MNKLSLVQQLKAARAWLNHKTWAKLTLHKVIDGRVCRCAHGAVQEQTGADDRCTVYAYDKAPILEGYLDIKQIRDIWNKRPLSIRENNTDANYLLSMIGLTTTFNDSKNTTLSMVKHKFTQAISIAKKLEKYNE